MLIHEKLNLKENMSDIEKSISDYFLKEPNSVKKISGRKLSELLFVAPSTITRFCKKLGYEGYNDFKEAFISEHDYLQSHFREIDPNQPFEGKDSLWTIANKISQLYKETVSDTLSIQNYENLEKSVNLLGKSDTIYIYTVGNHFNLATHFKNKMIEIGKKVEVISRFDLAFYMVNYSRESDCFLIISYSGETNDIKRIIEGIKGKKIPTLALTSFGDNTLSNFADEVLNISTREKLINNSGTFSSDLSVMYLLDILYAGLFSNDFQVNLQEKNKIAKSYQKFRQSDNSLIND